MGDNFYYFIIKKTKGCLNRLRLLYGLKILKDPFLVAVKEWFKDPGNSTLRLHYPLDKDSIVFDVGGYKGEWAEKIIKLYNPYVYIFEPVPKYCSEIVNKFSLNPKVSIYNIGLSDENKKVNMAVLSNSSSIYKKGKNYISIQLRDISDFLREIKVPRIDLIKINIEGGEYPLLERMINTQTIEKCQDIQVQFHNFIPNAENRRNKIRESLRKTHFATYNYPFVWENWRKNK